MVALNRAMARAYGGAPKAAMAEVEALRDQLGSHHLFLAARAELLFRTGLVASAIDTFDEAARRAPTPAEADFLLGRRAQLVATGGADPAG